MTGNHEAYAGLKDALAFTERAGFVTLRGRAVTVAGLLDVAGVDDPAVASGGSERDLLASLPRDRFTLLLKHRPRVDPDAVGLFDLQLSGHTHDGQIFPFTVVVRLAHPTMAGRYPLSQGSELYVSRGSGTWGPPFRVGAPPEVTIVELVRKAPSAD